MVQSTAQVLEERGTRYGVFMGQARIAQSLHIVLEQGMKLAGKTRFDFAPDQLEAVNMIVNKLGRIYNGDPNYADSWRDIAGYATLVADRLDKEQNQRLLESHNDGNRTETETNRSDNEPSQARRDVGQEENTAVGSVGRPTGRSELRRLPVRLEVQDGIHSATSETQPGIPGASGL